MASKQEALAAAKARNDMSTHSNAKPFIVEGKVGGQETLKSSDLPQLPVIHFRNNKKCDFTISADVTAVKVMFEACTECTLSLCGSISTGVVEVWNSLDCRLHASTDVGTLQLDLCKKLTVTYSKAEHLGSLVQAGVHDLCVKFEDGQPELELGLAELRSRHPEDDINDTTDQFITRIVEGKPLTERLIRLANDFPTTAREKKEFDEQARQKAEAMEKLAAGLLTTDMPKEEAEALRQRVADATNKAASTDEDTSPAARAAYKKKAGNEAFGAQDWAQAGVYYTEAILIEPSAALYSNRAACFLKMNQHAKVIADADACLAIDPDFVKAHFRKALALMALERWEEAGVSFATTLKLDPNNKDARASIQIAHMKAARARASR